jgi:phosphoglycerol transferase MdoB-like AlkP superfamily enzyme
MELAIKTREVEWWFWFVTLVFIISALIGWIPGYYIVMVISCIQIWYFVQKEGGLMAFPTQVRIAYFVFTLFGLWAAIRFPFYIVLLIGTVMVTFTGRCFIALVLKLMPWNKNLAPGASCEIGSVEK